MPAPSVRLLEIPHDCDHWVDFFSDSHFWLLLPTGQRIVLDLATAQLLSELPQDLHLRLLAAEQEWALAKLKKTPTGVCLHQREEAALILNVRHGWTSQIPWLATRLKKARNAPGGSHLFGSPGECMVSSKGAALLKLFHYAHGGAASDISSYHLYTKKGKLRYPAFTPHPDELRPGLTPGEVLRQMGCPDWIGLGRNTIWDYYHPLGGGSVARTTVEWGPEDQMQTLHRERMQGQQIAERANHHLASGGLLGPRNPPKILEIRA
jgi:hypothetical protein